VYSKEIKWKLIIIPKTGKKVKIQKKIFFLIWLSDFKKQINPIIENIKIKNWTEYVGFSLKAIPSKIPAFRPDHLSLLNDKK